MNTVDRYQGRDKDCIIVSLIRCNDKKNVSRYLRGWEDRYYVVDGSHTCLGGTVIPR